MENIKVIRIGLGEVTSSWGSYEGYPALFLEHADPSGVVGEIDSLTEKNEVRPGSVILQIHNPNGMEIIKQDIESALGLFKDVG